ncbi:bf39f676-2a84-494a-b0f5-f6e4a54381db [Thermothielavioides terrestris]|uniref:Bf39f676-2a84-494a-b0f5-f6e4a54381db n=1 Tax=Thermothielavioides terrestris TaxID=2587410 RepID=A0A3S4AJJ7_9PEZI|nr:bf39f676-2a84-494a-b0f5-f6e4a54381db [Thermothielavioides terrestris]
MPQGSPLSPALFILFITPLFRALEAYTGLLTVGIR